MSIRDIVRRRRGDSQEWHPLSALHDQMDRLFEDFPGDFDLPLLRGHRGAGASSPRVDVEETDKELRVTAELPGLEDQDVRVFLDKDQIVIEGEKQQQQEDRGRDFYRVERSFGSFRRAIPLPYEVEADKVNAQFKKGVLTVVLPRPAGQQRQRKQIEVKTE